MRHRILLLAFALLATSCVTLPAVPGPAEDPPVRFFHAIDRGDDSFPLTEGMRGVFRGSLANFGRDWRSTRGSLVRVRVAGHSGGAWDVDVITQNAPFAERLHLVFDDRQRLAGFWYGGAGSGLMTEGELRDAFAALPGQVAVFAQAAEHPEIAFAHRADQPQPVASQYKVMLLAQACVEVARGQRGLTDRLPIPAEVRGTPSCVLCKFDPGLAPTLRDDLHLLVADSDNTAADFLRDLLGREAVARTARAAGVLNVPPLISTQGLFALECGLGPLRHVPVGEWGKYLAALSPEARVAAADAAAREGFADGPEKFGAHCDGGHATGEARKAVSHVVDWPMRVDQLVALYEAAQLGKLDSPEASRCFLRFMGDGGDAGLGGDHFPGAGSKNGIETDVRSVGLVAQSDRGPIAVSVAANGFPDEKGDAMLGLLYAGARALVTWTYARLPARSDHP